MRKAPASMRDQPMERMIALELNFVSSNKSDRIFACIAVLTPLAFVFFIFQEKLDLSNS